jgi:hypothetical protein
MASDRQRRARRRKTVALNLTAVAALVGAVAIVAMWRFQG